MNPTRLPAAAFLALALATVLPAAPDAPAEESPIQGMEKALAELTRQGKDVAGLRTELDRLRPQWEEIDAQRRQLEAKVHAFAPQVEAWMKKAQGLAGGEGGQPGEPPLVGLQRGLDQLRAHGLDVAPLQERVETLRPDWSSIEALQKKLMAGLGNPADAKELERLIQAFRPKVEGLMHELQAKAATLQQKPAQGG